jgi:hypothetical protein
VTIPSVQTFDALGILFSPGLKHITKIRPGSLEFFCAYV